MTSSKGWIKIEKRRRPGPQPTCTLILRGLRVCEKPAIKKKKKVASELGGKPEECVVWPSEEEINYVIIVVGPNKIWTIDYHF